LIPPNLALAQPLNAGSSSLMKKPRYLTRGWSARAPAVRNRSVCGHRHVGPPRPGRDADPFGQVVGPEDRAAPVGADDDQGARDAGDGPLDHDLPEAFPLARQVLDLQLAALDQGVDGRAGAEHADDHRRAAGLGQIGQLGRLAAADAAQVSRRPSAACRTAGSAVGST
jgi:hypothetical protein